VAGRENELEVNADKLSTWSFMSLDQSAGRSHEIKRVNNFFERAEEFKYLGKSLKNQNFIDKENKSRMKS
jgi:hypothetical protein